MGDELLSNARAIIGCEWKVVAVKVVGKRGQSMSQCLSGQSSEPTSQMITQRGNSGWSLGQDGHDGWLSSVYRCPFECLNEEIANHLFGSYPIAALLWSRLATAYLPQFASVRDVESLWQAGASLVTRNDKSNKGSVICSIVPACAWVLWLARNEVVLNARRVYFDNMWIMATRCIMDWGLHLLGASVVRFVGDQMVCKE
ncbi:hypothetical protein QJS10_CPB18g00764 [Acorus calamus]|uniref:Reverse transcriptase zinc-binding domain-containing protein n=1 Tax=Acorus calamus TaxID=4465 RepID=A0AAV9CRL5_ACOCL|nr:hypothetical protein QJS10_CPB18g00764 [Acorus calamus]